MNPILRSYLIRSYYFAESLAFYERYYAPIVSSSSQARDELTDPGRHSDRPPTWVPLVFHCTTEDHAQRIFESGRIEPCRNGTVSLTEIPIGELDRMKYRHHAAHQVAIGFPRRFLESCGFSSVLYLRHDAEIRQVFAELREREPDRIAKLAPYVEESDDVSPFQEIRTRQPIPVEYAVWVLTTRLKDGRPAVSGMEAFQGQYGKCPLSYWHRDHQLDVLQEWQFASLERDEAGQPTAFRFIGEHYWRQEITEQKELKIHLPVHDRNIIFDVSKGGGGEGHGGPWRFIDVARFICRVLCEAGESPDVVLPYRLIENVI